MAMEGVASAIKDSVELDLKKTCDTIRDELFRCAGDVDETRYESVRDCVAETSTNEVPQLESHIQKMLTNTQVEMNLQVLRQADATTAIREYVKTNGARMDRQSQESIDCLISTIASLVKKEGNKGINDMQMKAPHSNYDALRQNCAPAKQPKSSQCSIEHSLSAVDVIYETVMDSVSEMKSEYERQRMLNDPLRARRDQRRSTRL